jgi:hypothetical protein
MLEYSKPINSPHDAIITEAVITPNLSNSLGISLLQCYIILKASTIEVNYSRSLDLWDTRCKVTDLNGDIFGSGVLDYPLTSSLEGTSGIGKAIWISKRATWRQLEGVCFLLVERAELDNAWKRIVIGSTLDDPMALMCEKRISAEFPDNVEEIMLT